MNGGYCLFDFTGVSTSAEGSTTIPGIYQKLYRCMDNNKPIVLYNVLDGEGLSTPIQAAATLAENTITLKTSLVTFTVTSADAVRAEE